MVEEPNILIWTWSGWVPSHNDIVVDRDVKHPFQFKTFLAVIVFILSIDTERHPSSGVHIDLDPAHLCSKVRPELSPLSRVTC